MRARVVIPAIAGQGGEALGARSRCAQRSGDRAVRRGPPRTRHRASRRRAVRSRLVSGDDHVGGRQLSVRGCAMAIDAPPDATTGWFPRVLFGVAGPVCRSLFRLGVEGEEHLPPAGVGIIAPHPPVVLRFGGAGRRCAPSAELRWRGRVFRQLERPPADSRVHRDVTRPRCCDRRRLRLRLAAVRPPHRRWTRPTRSGLIRGSSLRRRGDWEPFAATSHCWPAATTPTSFMSGPWPSVDPLRRLFARLSHRERAVPRQSHASDATSSSPPPVIDTPRWRR